MTTISPDLLRSAKTLSTPGDDASSWTDLVDAQALQLNPFGLVLHRQEDIGILVLPLTAHPAGQNDMK